MWLASLKVAMCTVGFTEMIKNLIPNCPGWLKTILAVVVGAGFACLNAFVPHAEEIMTGAMGVSIATVAYDIILKRLKEMAEHE